MTNWYPFENLSLTQPYLTVKLRLGHSFSNQATNKQSKTNQIIKITLLFLTESGSRQQKSLCLLPVHSLQQAPYNLNTKHHYSTFSFHLKLLREGIQPRKQIFIKTTDAPPERELPC